MSTNDTTENWYSNESATFGDRLAAAREAIGMDQKTLAARLGVKLTTVERWEDDQSEPRANKLNMLAGVLNVSMRWLLTGEGEGLDGPAEEEALPADVQSLMGELRMLQATLTRVANRLGRTEKLLKQAMQDSRK